MLHIHVTRLVTFAITLVFAASSLRLQFAASYRVVTFIVVHVVHPFFPITPRLTSPPRYTPMRYAHSTLHLTKRTHAACHFIAI